MGQVEQLGANKLEVRTDNTRVTVQEVDDGAVVIEAVAVGAHSLERSVQDISQDGGFRVWITARPSGER